MANQNPFINVTSLKWSHVNDRQSSAIVHSFVSFFFFFCRLSDLRCLSGKIHSYEIHHISYVRLLEHSFINLVIMEFKGVATDSTLNLLLWIQVPSWRIWVNIISFFGDFVVFFHSSSTLNQIIKYSLDP